jgi:hypothetical protein
MTEFSTRPDGHHALRAPRPSALWFGLFGAPAAWTVMFMVSYGMSAHFCYPKDTPLSTPTFGGLRAALGALLLGALIVAAAAGLVALETWRATNEKSSSTDPPGSERTIESPDGRTRWMALGGIFVSLLFVFLILLSGVPVLLVPPCSYGA